MGRGDNHPVVLLDLDFADPAIIRLTYSPSPEFTLGSQLRAERVCKVVLAALGSHNPQSITRLENTISAIFESRYRDSVQEVQETIVGHLNELQKEKLTPKMVEEVLGITPQERSRWGKDGRLPRSGSAMLRKGQQRIVIYTHAPSEIAKIAANRQLIEQWRREDRAQKEHG